MQDRTTGGIPTTRIRVLVVDDSALIRSVLREIIGSQPAMEVVGVAPASFSIRALTEPV